MAQRMRPILRHIIGAGLIFAANLAAGLRRGLGVFRLSERRAAERAEPHRHEPTREQTKQAHAQAKLPTLSHVRLRKRFSPPCRPAESDPPCGAESEKIAAILHQGQPER